MKLPWMVRNSWIGFHPVMELMQSLMVAGATDNNHPLKAVEGFLSLHPRKS